MSKREKERTCKLCGLRPAKVPDREAPRRFAEVCDFCHRERLSQDLKLVLRAAGFERTD